MPPDDSPSKSSKLAQKDHLWLHSYNDMQSKIIFELLLQPDLHYEKNLKAYEIRFAGFKED